MNKMFRYEIFCGLDVNGMTSGPIQAVSKHLVLKNADAILGDYTYFEGQGRWKGCPEACIVVVYLTDDPTSFKLVNEFCLAYKEENNQEAVLYTKNTVEARFV